MVGELTETVIRTIQDAANRLTGAERRKFEGQVARDYCQGSARKAETVFGWGRVTVQTGLDELQTGMARENRYADRGRRKTEDKLPPLEEDIRKLLYAVATDYIAFLRVEFRCLLLSLLLAFLLFLLPAIGRIALALYSNLLMTRCQDENFAGSWKHPSHAAIHQPNARLAT